MALKDEWQAQQQQRQHELAQRQQEVAQTLATIQQERQQRAFQIRNDLSSFRQHLTQSNAIRSLHAQQFRSHLHQETQAFLAAAYDRRQTQAQILASQLDEFVQALQQQTADFLTLTAAERMAMAHQLAQNLTAFHQDLRLTVTALRQEMHLEIQKRQADVQLLLTANQQQRLQIKTQFTQELATFVEQLRQEVQTYLCEIEMLRQVRAEQLNQVLAQSRIERSTNLHNLFDRLAHFRIELQQFHINLKHSVWGSDLSQPTTISPPSQPQTITATSTATPTPAPRSIPPAIVFPTQESKPTTKDSHEKGVYNYIHQVQGARLTEIESALNITRFQAVDALRSLITKKLVTQRDRVYLAQDFTL